MRCNVMAGTSCIAPSVRAAVPLVGHRLPAPAAFPYHRSNFGQTAMNSNNHASYFQNGFTLIELMVAVVIVAILGMIAIPSYADYVKRSRIIDALQDQLAIVQIRQYDCAFVQRQLWRFTGPQPDPRLPGHFCRPGVRYV